MHTAIAEIERAQTRSDIPDFRPGDTLKVHVRVTEGNRSRIQVFQGVVIRRQGSGARETFTVRKISYGVGVERTFPVHSPSIEKIEPVTRGRVRRAKLYYLGNCAAGQRGSGSVATRPAADVPGRETARPDVWARTRQPDPGPKAPGSLLVSGSPSRTKPGPPAEDGPDEPGRAPAARKRKHFWRELLIIVVAAAVLTLVVKAFVVQVYKIPSASMENTLQVGDRVLVNKLVYRFRGVARGDIVVFSGQDSWGPDAAPPPTNPVLRVWDGLLADVGLYSSQTYYIKRVIGLPGDRVACCTDGKVTVNGVALSEGSYLYPGDAPSFPFKTVIVPAGHLWVMGDHRGDSDDSRYHTSDPGGGADTGGRSGRPGVPDHLAAVADPRSAHPVDLRPGRAARGGRGSGRARHRRRRRDRGGRRGGRPGGRGRGGSRRDRRAPAPAAPPRPPTRGPQARAPPARGQAGSRARRESRDGS